MLPKDSVIIGLIVKFWQEMHVNMQHCMMVGEV
jgi:hypothetical protein